MKRLLLSIAIIFPSFIFAQHTELGIFLGASNYIGELSNDNSTLYWNESKPAFGILGRYNMNDKISIKGGLNYSWIAGDDANTANQSIRNRNLSFKTRLLEFSVTGEWNIPGYQPYGLKKPFSPYLFAGVALTSFNPKAEYEGEWVALQPLGTEGQGIADYGSPYSKTTFAVPFGLGVKWALNDAMNIGFEAGARLTFNDYLDDVGGLYADYGDLLAGNGEIAAALGNRTGELFGGDPVIVDPGTLRGNPDTRDWYFTGGIFFSYNFLDNGLVGIRKKIRRVRRGCYD